jgi:hypothetical protein
MLDLAGIDMAAVEAKIWKQARIALQGTGQFALDHAQHHAPVRRVFKGGRVPRQKQFSRDHGVFHQGQYFNTAPIDTKRVYDLWKASRSKDHRVDTPGRQFLGHANSMHPVFSYAGGKYTADFRNVDVTGMRMDQGTGKLVATGGKLKTAQVWNQPSGGKAERAGVRTGEQELNAEGRYALKTGRGIYTQRLKDAQGRAILTTHTVSTLGGRLRGEIHLSGIIENGKDEIWIYVISPVEYAGAQEFGTAHNRAHPYLRPALYESRSEFRNQVMRAIGGSKRRINVRIKMDQKGNEIPSKWLDMDVRPGIEAAGAKGLPGWIRQAGTAEYYQSEIEAGRMTKQEVIDLISGGGIDPDYGKANG